MIQCWDSGCEVPLCLYSNRLACKAGSSTSSSINVMGSMLVTAARHVIKAVFAGVPVMYFDPIATIPAVST